MITSNVGVAINLQKYKPYTHEYHLHFQLTTTVHARDDPTIPMYGFEFTSFESIQDFLNDKIFLVGKY